MTGSARSFPLETPGYDAGLRRETPLAAVLRERIRTSGPLSLAEYQDVCLNDPSHGYYRNRLAIGRGGDFITAPEISQVFGELIGLWCVVAWQQMGSPKPFRLIELGPGRGTLMRDMIRAAGIARGFLDSAEIWLVEPSPTLREVQGSLLGETSVPIQWCGSIEEIEAETRSGAGLEDRNDVAILIGNEFLDVLPADQLVRSPNGWSLRHVALDQSDALSYADLALKLGDHARLGLETASLEALMAATNPGDIVTIPRRDAALSRILASFDRLAALFIDYGYCGASRGDTFQAVRDQRYEHPLTSPGEADLTHLIDFDCVKRQFSDDFLVDGPVSQGDFLGRLGIIERASRLMSANPSSATTIESGVARLLSPQGMGGRFQAIGIRTKSVRPLPGF